MRYCVNMDWIHYYNQKGKGGEMNYWILFFPLNAFLLLITHNCVPEGIDTMWRTVWFLSWMLIALVINLYLLWWKLKND